MLQICSGYVNGEFVPRFNDEQKAHHMYGGDQWTSVENLSDIKRKVVYKFNTTLV